MKHNNRGNFLGIILSVLVLAVVFSSPFRMAFSFPDAISVAAGELFTIDTGFPVVSAHSPYASSVEAHPFAHLPTKLVFEQVSPGSFQVEFRLFGLIPIRKVSLIVEEPVMVMPGGHSIGVILRSQGVVITGFAPVDTIDGRQVWPAKNSGAEIGDIILSIDDQKIKGKEDLSVAVDAAGRTGQWLDILLKKPDGSTLRKAIAPVKHKDGGYRLGLYVKDSLAGVGTLTFYQEETNLYTALGHVIADNDSKRPLTMEEGQIVRSTVTGIQPSKKGSPGEFLGVFVEDQDVIGNIIKNGSCGISGMLSQPLVNPYYSKAIPLGLPSQLVKGPAEVLTTVNGRKIEKFEIEIESIFTSGSASSKGFMIKITDDKLLSSTGGIVQGMSGSPIIQNGRLIGAITHVLVNDPTKGYGAFAQWMAQEAYIVPGVTDADYRAAFKTFQ